MTAIRIKRGTRAQLDSAAGASQLVAGEPYLITDEDRMAVGTSATAYETYATQGHGHANTEITGLGTASTHNVPASGDASATEVVLGDDTRLGAGGSYSAPYRFINHTGGLTVTLLAEETVRIAVQNNTGLTIDITAPAAGEATNAKVILDNKFTGAITSFITTADVASDWVASTAYAVGDVVVPTTPTGRVYQVVTAGTSGASEPTWNTTGGSTGDNTVVWKEIYSWPDNTKPDFSAGQWTVGAMRDDAGRYEYYPIRMYP